MSGFGLDTSPRQQWEPRGRQSRFKLQVAVCYALAIMLFGTAAMNTGFAAESAPHGAKGKADAAGDKSVGTKSDGGGANIEVPQADSAGAGIKAGGATEANDGAKGTDAGSRVERETVTRGPSDSGVHTGTNSEGSGTRSNTERGVGTSATNDGGTQTHRNETPIDLRITVQSPAKSKNTTKVPDWTKRIGTSNKLHNHQTSAPRLRIDLERNAIGVLTPREFVPIGIAKNAASIALGNLSSVGRTDTGPLVSSPAPTVRTKTNAPPVNTATNPAVLNGSGMGHQGGGTGTIGGAAKSVAGINGTSFRAKHP
jgi:hypothetical protein